MNIILTIIGAVIGGAIAFAPAGLLIWFSENTASQKASKTAKAIGSIYLWTAWIPLTILLVAQFITRLTNG